METESVWDYPRPPRLEIFSKPIEILLDGKTLVKTTGAMRVLETSHPPVYYIPQLDIAMQYLKVCSGSTFCEWKGAASYWDIEIDDHRISRAAWSYADPTAPFLAVKDYIAFYADKMDSCFVDGNIVRAQAGNFYGGWITDNIIGPFKGAAGTQGW